MCQGTNSITLNNPIIGDSHLLWTSVGGPAPEWPPPTATQLFDSAAGRSVTSVAHFGPHLLAAYAATGAFVSSTLAGATFAKLHPGPRIAVFGTDAAIEYDGGVKQVSLASMTALSLQATYAGLHSPVMTLTQLCGISIGATAELVCFDRGTHAEARRISLGATTATIAHLVMRGRLAAVAFVGEGVRLVDLTSNTVTASAGIDITDVGDLSIDGPFLYAGCTFGMCQIPIQP